LRGLHLQLAPSAEGKLVRCVRGCVVDVVLDLRAHSATYLQHVAIELDAGNRRAIFIPPGCAHGFQTLADDTELLYYMTDYYQPELASGVRWNDPAFGIAWPDPDPILSPRDAGYPDFDSSSWRQQITAAQGASRS
jgi:dTDP-4-dehydrorhamnose 3,5-epimerase